MAQLAQVPKGGTAGGRDSGELREWADAEGVSGRAVISQAKGRNWDILSRKGDPGGSIFIFCLSRGRRTAPPSFCFDMQIGKRKRRERMEQIYKAIEKGNGWLNDIVWGIPALVLLMAAGIILTVGAEGLPVPEVRLRHEAHRGQDVQKADRQGW